MNRDDNLNWFHGKISRESAEQLLKDEGEDGVFLVRESNTSTGDYVLSVLHEGEVVHYHIRRHGEDAFFSIEEHTTVHGLDTLIQHYQGDSSGLVTRLAVVCRGEPPPHNSRTHGRTNLLHRATERGNYTVVSEMLACGYHSRDAKNQDGQTAVHLASKSGKDDILAKLIQSGASVNCRDTAGFTPLHYACQFNLVSTVKLLIVEGNANVQTRHAQTGKVPMHEAAQRGNTECVIALLELHAPVNPRTVNNEIPADLAKENNHIECYNVLKRFTSPKPETTRAQWYHGTLNREEAVNLLNNYCKMKAITSSDGAFLVRYSDRNSGAFVLTMLCENVTYNFIIRKQGNYLFIDDGPYLDSLEHLIDHYGVMSDGLPTCLRLPVPPMPKPPLPEFSTMPRIRKTSSNQSKSSLTASLKCSKSTRKGSLPANSDKTPPIPLLSTESKSIDMLTRNLSFSTDFIDPNIISNLNNMNNNNSINKSPVCLQSTKNNDTTLATNNNVNHPKKEMLSNPATRIHLLGSALSLPPNANNGELSNLDEQTYNVPRNNDPVIPITEKCSDLNISASTELSTAQDFIPSNRLTFGNVLGEGEFASVLRGTYTPPSGVTIPVAIKTLHSQHADTNKDEFLREARVMMGLNHPCIVQLIGISMSPQLVMVQELAPLGSLLAFLLDNPKEVCPMYELKLWACQVACGMRFLEEKRFVHRDLATRNILLSDKHQAKISDFGLSRALSTDSSYYTASQGGKWPIKWYAPESYNFGSFSHKSDVWSFGVTLWEMYSYGKQPYGDKRGADAIQIVESGERLEQPEDCPQDIYTVMKDCWAYEPQNRPTFNQLVEIFSSHPEYMNISQIVMESEVNV